jgi:hypothetical protein
MREGEIRKMKTSIYLSRETLERYEHFKATLPIKTTSNGRKVYENVRDEDVITQLLVNSGF